MKTPALAVRVAPRPPHAVAARASAQGEELTLAYCDAVATSRTARRAKLRDRYQFDCACALCEHERRHGDEGGDGAEGGDRCASRATGDPGTDTSGAARETASGYSASAAGGGDAAETEGEAAAAVAARCGFGAPPTAATEASLASLHARAAAASSSSAIAAAALYREALACGDTAALGARQPLHFFSASGVLAAACARAPTPRSASVAGSALSRLCAAADAAEAAAVRNRSRRRWRARRMGAVTVGGYDAAVLV